MRREDWETPDSLFRVINAYHGPFELDACATAKNAKTSLYISRPQDGLEVDWGFLRPRRIWCNPPYHHIEDWVIKAEREAKKGHEICMLVPVWSDRAWWCRATYYGAVRFLRERVQFVGAPGRPRFASALLLLGYKERGLLTPLYNSDRRIWK